MGLGKRLSLTKGSKKVDAKDAKDVKDAKADAKAAPQLDLGAEEAVVPAVVPDVVPAAAPAAPTEAVDEHREDNEPPWQLAGAWLQRARDELAEDPNDTAALLGRLRQLVLEDGEQGGLRARCDDAFLIRFLRARKFNLAKAHKTLQRYYLMKRKHPNLFRADGVDRLAGMMAAQLHAVLDGRAADGCPVLTVKIDNYDGAEHTVDDFFRLNVVALEQVVRDPRTQVTGITVVVDLSGFGMQHAPFLSPYYVKNTTEVIQESFPLRFKGFHVVNQPFYFAALFAIVKPFLKDKMKRRVALHGGRWPSLHQVVPAEALSPRYGGTLPACPYARWAEAVHGLAGYFARLESFGYPEEGDEADGRRRVSLFSLGRRQSQVSSDAK